MESSSVRWLGGSSLHPSNGTCTDSCNAHPCHKRPVGVSAGLLRRKKSSCFPRKDSRKGLVTGTLLCQEKTSDPVGFWLFIKTNPCYRSHIAPRERAFLHKVSLTALVTRSLSTTSSDPEKGTGSPLSPQGTVASGRQEGTLPCLLTCILGALKWVTQVLQWTNHVMSSAQQSAQPCHFYRDLRQAPCGSQRSHTFPFHMLICSLPVKVQVRASFLASLPCPSFPCSQRNNVLNNCYVPHIETDTKPSKTVSVFSVRQDGGALAWNGGTDT
jgi:hypothetical protein